MWPTHTAWSPDLGDLPQALFCVMVGPVGSLAHRTVMGIESSIYWVCQVPGTGLSLLLILSLRALMKEAMVSPLVLQTMRRLGEVSRHTGVTARKWHHSQVSPQAP